MCKLKSCSHFVQSWVLGGVVCVVTLPITTDSYRGYVYALRGYVYALRYSYAKTMTCIEYLTGIDCTHSVWEGIGLVTTV